jgi:Mn2+/Fe2+ NRAMP family transporter
MSTPVQLLVISAFINGVAGPFLVPVMLISDNRNMGDHGNGRIDTVFGWLTAALVAATIVSLAVG